MTEDGLEDVLGPASLAQQAHTRRRVFVGRRMRGVRKALVVEVVDETRQPPTCRILAEMLGVGAHRGFYRQHVLAKGVARGVLVHQSERVRARRKGRGGRNHPVNIPPSAASAPLWRGRLA